MAYQSWSVVFGEQPTAAKWNILGTNDAGFNDGTAIGTDAIADSKLIYGKIRGRRGGSATNWSTPGTTNYTYDATNTFIQCGAVTASTDGTDVAVTFPVAFNQVPIIITGLSDIVNSNAYTCVDAPTTTGFNVRNLTAGAAGGNVIGWIAIGE